MEDLQQKLTSAYEEHSDALFRYCFFKVSDRELAKDLLQDAFFRAWRHIAAGKEVGNMKAFLYKVVGNLVIDEYRKRAPDDSLDTLHEEVGFEPSVDDTDRWADSLDGAQAVLLIKQVPPPYGEALFMRFVQELSIGEIADITGASENAVAVRVHRGLEKLKKLYNHDE